MVLRLVWVKLPQRESSGLCRSLENSPKLKELTLRPEARGEAENQEASTPTAHQDQPAHKEKNQEEKQNQEHK